MYPSIGTELWIGWPALNSDGFLVSQVWSQATFSPLSPSNYVVRLEQALSVDCRMIVAQHYGLISPTIPEQSAVEWSPWANRLSIGGGGRPGHATDPASVADRWVRQLEEETGAICESRVDVGGGGGNGATAMTTGAAAGAGPGPSTLSSRRSALSKAAGQRVLPDFYMGSYESALRVAEKEMRPMMVVLVSEEHDDVADFKRMVLVDEDLVRVLRENDFVVWGGDVRDYEASQASQKLGATTYPFVAFVALQPRGGRNSSSSILTVLSRHQGPAVPRSPQLSASSNTSVVPTAASTLVNHLTNTLLPRVTPHLGRLRGAAAERALAARLIAEQNAAFQASADRDRERIEMAEIAIREREEEERRRKREEEERKLKEEEEFCRRESEKAERLLWWRYARRCLLAPEPSPSSTDGGKPVRIALRLPSGARVVRLFSPSTPITQLYIAAASNLIPQEHAPSDDPKEPPSTYRTIQSVAAVESKCWNFALATTYPRVVIPGDGKSKIGDIRGLRYGGVVAIEMQDDIPVSPPRSIRGGEDDSDGYETEED
ncbi:hypothetical protein SCHPADRAFT_915548 [Schizopora paradoxa]|uniref:UBX domain-containing protein n=1 Tax=Schizopora paradoxa TaxID=27342 RepID=A0A0H2S742_9AGAM|nr:hypothetical protein SCHPADRAFT_915548 [Schizopora paradoxa]